MFDWKPLWTFVDQLGRDPSFVLLTGQSPALGIATAETDAAHTNAPRALRRTYAPAKREMLGMLDDETRAEHATADADLYRVLDDPTEHAYRHYLAATYHFVYTVELRLAAVVDVPTHVLARCSQAAALLDDLLALGADRGVLEVLARPIDLPPIETVAQAFGWMYVVQRNTLHHRALFRALAPRMRATLRFASRYLTARASDAYEQWFALGSEMDRVATDGDLAANIVGAAKEAFAHQHRWYVEAWATRTPPPARLRVAR